MFLGLWDDELTTERQRRRNRFFGATLIVCGLVIVVGAVAVWSLLSLATGVAFVGYGITVTVQSRH